MLTKSLQRIINKIISKNFTSLRLNLLGPDRVSKSMLFSLKNINYDPKTSIGSAYLHANALNSTNPQAVDVDTVNRLKDVAENYIDQLEQKTIADVTRIIGDNIAEIQTQSKLSGDSVRDIFLGESGQEILKKIKESLKEQNDKVNKAAEVLVNHELHNAQNYGAFDGLVESSRSLGIQDPTIFKIGVLDENRCKVCWKFWTLEDKITPRVYKVSELTANPGHWKNPTPSVSPTHINCRDINTILMPGFGFDSSGKVIYKGKNESGIMWNEYSFQKTGNGYP